MLSLPPIGASIRDAREQVRHFSTLVTWATVTVAAGVAFEGLELIHDAVRWIKERRIREKELADLREVEQVFPASEMTGETQSMISDHPRLVKVIGRVGLIVVVIGVVAEWRCGAKLEDAHNVVHKLEQNEFAESEFDLRVSMQRFFQNTGVRVVDPFKFMEILGNAPTGTVDFDVNHELSLIHI